MSLVKLLSVGIWTRLDGAGGYMHIRLLVGNMITMRKQKVI